MKNIEDELIRSMGLKNIEEFLKSKSKKDFKRDMLKERNLKSKFESHHFDIQKLWAMNPLIRLLTIQRKSKSKLNYNRSLTAPFLYPKRSLRRSFFMPVRR